MFSPQLPDLRALELLESIARTGSITLAAGELGITQQAASLRVRRLEHRLGRELVVRAARSSHLTGDGAALLALAQPVLRAAAEMDEAWEAFVAPGTAVSVAASLTIAEHFLPQWIMTFVQNGNDPRSIKSQSTNTREVVRRVFASEADIGFVEGSEPPPGLSYAFLAQDELGVYVAPEHPWATLRRISPWTLAETPLVTREVGSGCRSVLLATLLQHGVDPSQFAGPALELPSNFAVLEAAAANVAPAVISTRPAERFIHESRLVRVSVDRVAFQRQLGAVWRQGKQPPTHAARELLSAALQTPARSPR